MLLRRHEQLSRLSNLSIDRNAQRLCRLKCQMYMMFKMRKHRFQMRFEFRCLNGRYQLVANG